MRTLSTCLAAVMTVPLFAASPAAEGLNRFAADSYYQLRSTKGDLVFSPLSISTALSMALAGARGQTAAQITSVLHAPIDSQLLDQLTRAGNGSGDQLLLAQALWVERAFPLRPGFVQALTTGFHAPPNPADFSTDPEKARAAINRWASEKTNGKIQDLFAPGSLKPSTRLVLTSAVYFNGKWQSKFDPKQTRPAPFHPTPDSAVETPFLNQTSRFAYQETANAQVLEMPYAGGALAFDVILPKPETPLASLEDALHSDGFSAWLGQLQQKRILVSLPKFRSECSFSLRDALSAMGMADAFSSAADFSGIAGGRDLALSEVKHKAYIDVSEEGTEAAAATGAVVALTAFAPPPRFVADRPFLYLIRDTSSGAILFAGRYTGPKP
jgi:serpin B